MAKRITLKGTRGAKAPKSAQKTLSKSASHRYQKSDPAYIIMDADADLKLMIKTLNERKRRAAVRRAMA
jgi:hypothetical protein